MNGDYFKDVNFFQYQYVGNSNKKIERGGYAHNGAGHSAYGSLKLIPNTNRMYQYRFKIIKNTGIVCGVSEYVYVDAFFYHQKHCNNYGYANDGDLCIKRQYQKGYGSSGWKNNDIITMTINLLTNQISWSHNARKFKDITMDSGASQYYMAVFLEPGSEIELLSTSVTSMAAIEEKESERWAGDGLGLSIKPNAT